MKYGDFDCPVLSEEQDKEKPSGELENLSLRTNLSKEEGEGEIGYGSVQTVFLCLIFIIAHYN